MKRVGALLVLGSACLAIAACAGTAPTGGATSVDGGPTWVDTDAAGSSGSSGSIGSSGSPGGACPCPIESYCELATNTCKPGCTADTECNPGRYCDTSTRTCKTGCRGDEGCPTGGQSCEMHACVTSAQCNAIAQLGTSVAAVAAGPTPPPAAGGAIANGTYVLTAVKVYGSSSAPGATVGSAGQLTTVIAGSTLTDVFQDAANAVARTRSGVTTSGSSVTITPSCKFPATGVVGSEAFKSFTATATTLTLFFSPVAGTTAEYTLTKK